MATVWPQVYCANRSNDDGEHILHTLSASVPGYCCVKSRMKQCGEWSRGHHIGRVTSTAISVRLSLLC